MDEKIRKKEARIAVIGLGYVGLPLLISILKSGFKATGIDKDGAKLEKIKNNENDEIKSEKFDFEKAIRDASFVFSDKYSELENVDIAIVTVPTPLTDTKEPDTSYIEGSIKKMIPHLHEDMLIILESTTYPGTTREIIEPELKKEGFEIGKDIYLAYSPERIDPGRKDFEFEDIPKVVGGITERCTYLSEMFYEQILNKVHTVSSPEAAEMAKLLENIFRNVNIALVNELALLCDEMDLNIWEIIEAAGTKPYGFMKFYPGPGVGGHCIPVDPFYLSWKAKEKDFRTRFIELSGEINRKMPQHVVEKAGDILNDEKKCINGSQILILGVTYKSGISDTRRSPGIEIIKLLERKNADVFYNDPYVDQIELNSEIYNSVELTENTLKNMDLTVITIDHSRYDYDFIASNSKLILDTRNAIVEPENVKYFSL